MPLGGETPSTRPEHRVKGLMLWSLASSSAFPQGESTSSQNPFPHRVFPTPGSFDSVLRLCAMMDCPILKVSTIPLGEVFVLPL